MTRRDPAQRRASGEPRRRDGRSLPDGDLVGLLDIGTSKVTCAIAMQGTRRDPPQLIALAVQKSRGVKAGVITDLSEAEQAVRAAVGAAEQQAGVTLESVIATLSCGRIKSRHFTANADLAERSVAQDDLDRLLAGGRAYARQDERRLIHLNRLQMRLDGVVCGNTPIGMAGGRLAADLHAVTADDGPIRNLVAVVERCFLRVDGLVAAPFASGMACTTEEERRLGVICVDIGGGTSSIAAFADGQFVFADAVPAGGNHVTYDVARALQTPLAEAERIKALYGSLVGVPSDLHDVISCAHATAEGVPVRTTKGHLQQIIQPRVTALIALIRERFERGGVTSLAGDRVVFTGGASQLTGFEDFAAPLLNCTVRIGSPSPDSGHVFDTFSPAFSAIAGLLAWPYAGAFDTVAQDDSDDNMPSYLSRVGQWLKTGF